jgi:hypothetical protein
LLIRLRRFNVVAAKRDRDIEIAAAVEHILQSE